MTVRYETTHRMMMLIFSPVFIISIGSIPPKKTVTTHLMFVMELFDDDPKGTLRLQLPMSVGSRYGPPPASLPTAVSASSQTRLSITVDIQMSGAIQDVTSPSHKDIQFAPYITEKDHTSRRRRRVTFASPTFLTQSFVLDVNGYGLDAPRCFAERDPRDPDTVAMQLTFVPTNELSPISTAEYLFLVDRSGSMKGPSIDRVKRALSGLLHMLPTERTFFNIFGFGSRVDSLWLESHQHDRMNLNLAVSSATMFVCSSDHWLWLQVAYVEGMHANYGNTVLSTALEFVFKHRKLDISTIVFLLTDGEVCLI